MIFSSEINVCSEIPSILSGLVDHSSPKHRRPVPGLILLVDPGARAAGSRSAGFSDWSAGCVCAGSAACPFECAGDWRGSFPWTICLAGCPHNKEGPRMVLVHVGYLVLPVFGSVRNRGMTSYTFSHSNTNNFLCVSSF